jgi:hypothetical protein
MELDDFKHTESVQSPSPDPLPAAGHDQLQSLVEEVKTQDATLMKALLIMLISFGALGLIYLTSISRNTGLMKTGYILLGGGFFLLEVYFFTKYRIRKKIDYAAPALEFLRKAEKRYTFWSLPDLLVSLPLLLSMGLGGGLIVYASFQKYFPGSFVPTIIYILIFCAAVAVGSYAGRKQWVQNNKPICEKIRQMREEFEGAK